MHFLRLLKSGNRVATCSDQLPSSSGNHQNGLAPFSQAKQPCTAILGGLLLSSALVLAAAEPVLSGPSEKWSIRPTRWVDSSPAVADDGTLYFGSFDQKFFAINPDGSIRWAFSTRSEIRSSPAIATDGTIYFGCRDRTLYAITPEGRELWRFNSGGWIDSSPALGRDGTIYFGSWDHSFYALNPDGSLKWKFQTEGPINSSPAVALDEAVCFGAHDGRVYVLDSTGRKRWEFVAGAPIISSPAIDASGNVYITSANGKLYSLDENGSLRWRLHTGGITESSPVISSNGKILLGVNNTVWSVTSDGQPSWVFPISLNLRSSITALPDGAFYCSCPYANLLKVNVDKQIVWSFYSDSDTDASLAVGLKGEVYLPGKQGRFISLSGDTPLGNSPWPKFRADRRNTGRVNPR